MADVKKTVQIDLEVDTNTVDSSQSFLFPMVNPVWPKPQMLGEFFQECFIHHIHSILYKVVVWYMVLPSPTMEQSGISFSGCWCRRGMVWFVCRHKQEKD